MKTEMGLLKKNKKTERTSNGCASADVNKKTGNERASFEDIASIMDGAAGEPLPECAGEGGVQFADMQESRHSRPYPYFLGKGYGPKARQCVYISREVHEKIADIVHTLGRNKTTIGAYIDKVLCEHLETYRAEINSLYVEHYLLREHV